MKNGIFALVLLWTACQMPKTPNQNAAKPDLSGLPLVFVGTYTEKLGHVDGKASGIYACRLDTLTGALTVVDSTTGIANPSFLTISKNKKFLYAVAENGGKPEQPFGSVAAYAITEGGKLQKLNEVPSNGVAPCHVSIDEKMLLVANYGTGNVVCYNLNDDGSIGDTLPVDKLYPEAKWAHMIIHGPNLSFYSIDKGADRIFRYLYKYAFNGIGQVNYFKTAPGAGPRHMDFTPDGKFAYVINELNSTIAAYSVAENGNLKAIQTVPTLPSDFKETNYCADIHVHPSGKFVYGSNRGHNSIVAYRIDPATGKLSYVGHAPTQGAYPRNFLITPNGHLLLAANQNSDNVVAFSIDPTTGNLTPTGQNSRVLTPVCLKML